MNSRHLIVAVLVGAGVVATAAPVRAETWTCLYKGTWVTTKTKNTDTMDWLLKWKSVDGGGWKVIGDYKDKYGHAWFDGTCDSTSCVFTQDYKEGKLAGKKYYFTGTYSDAQIDENTSQNSFTGTWGSRPDNRTNGGTWDSVATCKKEVEGKSTPPATKPSPPPPPKTAGTGNPTVEEMLPGHQNVGAWSVETNSGTAYLVGGCRLAGPATNCTADLFTKTGKLIKSLSAEIDDETNNLADLDKMKRDLDKLLDHNQGNKLTQHDLDKGPVVYENLTMKWDAKTRVLSVFDGKKLFKKVAGPKVPKGMRLDGSSVYLFEAGSPPAAVLQLDMSETEGISSDHPAVVFPLPAIEGGD